MQPEVQSNETPNAIALHASEAKRIMQAISGGDSIQCATSAEMEIGIESVSQNLVDKVSKSLQEAPPVKFDIARQVRVFEAYLQYVELRLSGVAIQRHRVRIPPAIQHLGAATDIEGRLRTTFDLIEKRSSLSSKQLETDLNEIRNNFTRSLGKDHGRVVLKSCKPLLKQRLEEFRQKLQEHQNKIRSELASHIDKSKEQVVEYYLPLARQKPPDSLLGQMIHAQPSDDHIREWLKRTIDRVFPVAEQLVTRMTVDERYKDMTFETLNQPDFLDSVKKAFPNVDWDRTYAEFRAAGEHAEKKQQ